ncbi:uncharacterized protein B0J16DRAFT_351617 [Fusarium flagelliforme]|uniref:uncharacterized protein n=1 Tax=Fusarium flagelliforme TaxID=2675880 RepID=UPI001E8D7737|nr:uncharacterized protein B0J16DRAFT_351617 [Fusarium flagelliforme]KAH7169824.1 hypothetical protein B0J16DRAFT_351617 [Fusarium flagelliforme]
MNRLPVVIDIVFVLLLPLDFQAIILFFLQLPPSAILPAKLFCLLFLRCSGNLLFYLLHCCAVHVEAGGINSSSTYFSTICSGNAVKAVLDMTFGKGI